MLDVQHIIPAAVGAALHAPAEGAGVDIAETMRPEHGDARRRMLYRTAPQRRRVQFTLRQAAFDVFDDWYERLLGAGAAPFYLRVAAQGDATGRHYGMARVWQAAAFAEPWQCEVRGHAGNFIYAVQAEIVLHGEPAATRPEIVTRAAGSQRTRGTARTEVPPFAAAGTQGTSGTAYAEE